MEIHLFHLCFFHTVHCNKRSPPAGGGHGSAAAERRDVSGPDLPPVWISLQLCERAGRAGTAGVQRCESLTFERSFSLHSRINGEQTKELFLFSNAALK